MSTWNGRVTGEAAPTFKERFLNYVDPGVLILVAMKEYVLTIFRILFVERSPSAIYNFYQLRDRAFSDFWQAVSPPPFIPTAGEAPPTFQGALSLLIPHLDEISGTVLDLGPGTGHLTHYYPPANITAIYGAEPNTGMHNAIRANADASRLGDRYHILSCGAEAESLIPAMKNAGLLADEKGVEVFDTIIAVRVLCGVPVLRKNMQILYSLLKPGGKLVMVEHVKNPWGPHGKRGGMVGRVLQMLYKPFWEFFIRCHLDADTEDLLEKLEWESVNLSGRMEWGALPWVGGTLVKKRV